MAATSLFSIISLVPTVELVKIIFSFLLIISHTSTLSVKETILKWYDNYFKTDAGGSEYVKRKTS